MWSMCLDVEFNIQYVQYNNLDQNRIFVFYVFRTIEEKIAISTKNCKK